MNFLLVKKQFYHFFIFNEHFKLNGLKFAVKSSVDLTRFIAHIGIKNSFYLQHVEYEGSIGLVTRKMKKNR
jgi:hypothetical protein